MKKLKAESKVNPSAFLSMIGHYRLKASLSI